MGKRLMVPQKMLRALYLAQSHMQEARAACVHLMEINCSDRLLEHAIFTGIVVSYARSFLANEGLSALPTKFRKFRDPNLQKLHDRLLEARKVIYGHKDETKEGESLSPGEPREELGKIRLSVAESGAVRWKLHRPVLLTEYLPKVIALCDYQLVRLQAESSDIVEAFCKGKSYSPGDYVLGESFP